MGWDGGALAIAFAVSLVATLAVSLLGQPQCVTCRAKARPGPHPDSADTTTTSKPGRRRVRLKPLLLSTASAVNVPVHRLYSVLCASSATLWGILCLAVFAANRERAGQSQSLNTLTMLAGLTAALFWALQAAFDYRVFTEAHMGLATFCIGMSIMWMFLGAGLAVAGEVEGPGSTVAWRFACAVIALTLSYCFMATFAAGEEQFQRREAAEEYERSLARRAGDGGGDVGADGGGGDTPTLAVVVVEPQGQRSEGAAGGAAQAAVGGAPASAGVQWQVSADGAPRPATGYPLGAGVEPLKAADSNGLRVAAVMEYLAVLLVAAYALSYEHELRQSIRIEIRS